MIRKVIVSFEAEADVQRLILFLVERAPEAALRANAAIRQAIDTLDQFSERGRPAPIEGYRELIIPFGKSAYVARYRVKAGQVLVTRIHHSHEDRSR